MSTKLNVRNFRWAQLPLYAVAFTTLVALAIPARAEPAPQNKGAMQKLVQFGNHSIALHADTGIYRSTGGIQKGYAGAEISYTAGKYPTLAMVSSKQGVYTAFRTADNYSAVYLSVSGRFASYGEIVRNGTGLVTDLIVHPSTKKPDAIITVVDDGMGGIYRSPDGNHLTGGGKTKLIYPAGKNRISAIAAANGGIYTAFKFASGSAIYFSADGLELGSLKSVYRGTHDVTRILVLPGKGVNGTDAVLTEFDNGKGGVYFSPDGENLGGGGKTTVAYPANLRAITDMKYANSGVYTVFEGRYVYFSTDGKNLGGGENSSIIYSGFSKVDNGRNVKSIHVERGTGLNGGDSIITGVTDENAYVEYKSRDGRKLTSGASTVAINSESTLNTLGWYQIDQYKSSASQLTPVKYDAANDAQTSYQAMQLGYNGFKLDPVSLENRGVYSGQMIFDVDSNDVVRYGDTGSIAPRSFIKVTRDRAYSATTGKVCFTKEQAESELRGSVSVEAGAMGYSAGIKGRYGQSEVQDSSSRNVLIIGRAYKSKYFLILHKPSIKLNKEFRDYVTRKTSSEVFTDFGTHYPISILFGSLKLTSKKVDEKAFSSSKTTSWGATVSGSGSAFGVDVSAEASVDGSNAISKEVSTQLEKAEATEYGADKPVPLRVLLRPIYELVRPEFFPDEDPATVLALKKKLKQAYDKYKESIPRADIKPDPFLARISEYEGNGRPVMFTFKKAHPDSNMQFFFETATKKRVKIDTQDYYVKRGIEKPAGASNIFEANLMAFPKIKDKQYDYGVAGGTVIVERTRPGKAKEVLKFPINNLTSTYQTLRDANNIGVTISVRGQEVAGSAGGGGIPYPVFPGALPKW